jgi:hypothetical protein
MITRPLNRRATTWKWHRGRLAATAASVFVTLGLATACEPAPPTATFTVNVAPGIAGDDVNPGDGVCETAPGNAQCTLDAAVQEGNALGQADINVPSTAVQGQGHALTETITGTLRFLSVWTNGSIEVTAADLDIAAEGSLHLERTDIHVTRTATIEGHLSVSRGWLVGWIDVRPTGVLTMVNSVGGAWSSDLAPPPANAWITNRGTAIMRFSEFREWSDSGDQAVVNTLGSGNTVLAGNKFGDIGSTSTLCLGNPANSQGYNFAPGCGLTGVGDQADTLEIWPVVPAGVIGCGTEVTTDFFGAPRPRTRTVNGEPFEGCNRGYSE